MPWLSQFCLVGVVGVTLGIARTCLDHAWIYLTIPAGALLVSVMAVFLTFPRAVRGLSPLYWPFRAAARRYVPWMCLVVGSFGLTILLFAHASTDLDRSASASSAGLLPDSPFLLGPLLLLAVVGALRMTLGVSLRLNRLRRVRPDTVLFLFVAALLIQASVLDDTIDRLPAALALACLIGDGVVSSVVLSVGYYVKRRAAGARA